MTIPAVLQPEFNNEPLVKIPSGIEVDEYNEDEDTEIVNAVDHEIEAERRLVVSMNALQAVVDFFESDVKIEDRNGVMRSIGPQLNAAARLADSSALPLVVADDILVAHPTAAVDVSLENIKDWIASAWQLFLKGYRAVKERIVKLLKWLKGLFVKSKAKEEVKSSLLAITEEVENDTTPVEPFTISSIRKFKSITFNGTAVDLNREWARVIDDVCDKYLDTFVRNLDHINDGVEKAITEARRVFTGGRQNSKKINQAIDLFALTTVSAVNEGATRNATALKWLKDRSKEREIIELYIGGIGVETTAIRSKSNKNVVYNTYIVPVSVEPPADPLVVKDLTWGMVKGFLKADASNSKRISDMLDKVTKADARNTSLINQLDELVKATQKTLMASGVKPKQLVTIGNYGAIVGRRVSEDYSAIVKAINALSVSYLNAQGLLLELKPKTDKSETV